MCRVQDEATEGKEDAAKVGEYLSAWISRIDMLRKVPDPPLDPKEVRTFGKYAAQKNSST